MILVSHLAEASAKADGGLPRAGTVFSTSPVRLLCVFNFFNK